MSRFFINFFLNVVAGFSLIAGIFLAIAGPLSGLGNDSLAARAGWCVVGLVLVVIGLTAFYYANNRSWSKVIGTILNTLLFNWGR